MLSVQSDSYSAAPAPNATIGNLSTTCSASCGSSTYTLVTGTDYAGMACDATTLQITGASLHEATGGNALGTYYPCVQSAQSGAATFVQRMTVQIGTSPQTVGTQIYGDDVALQSGQTYPIYPGLVGSENGKALTNRAVASSRACDATLAQVINASTPTVATSSNPLAILEFGGVEASTMGVGAYEAPFKACLTAMAVWLGTPSKQLGSTGTQGGSGWGSDSGGPSGTFVASASAGATLTFTVTPSAAVPNVWNSNSCGTSPVGVNLCTGVVWILYKNFSGGNTGSFTYTVDGGSPVTVTPYSDAGAVRGVGAQRIQNLSNTAHTIVLTVGSNTGQALSFGGVATAPKTYASRILIAGVLKEQGDANSAATAAYDKDAADVAALLADDLLDVLFVPVRSYVSVANMVGLIPNAAGHAQMVLAFQGQIPKCLDVANGRPLPSYVISNLQGVATCLAFDDEGTSISTVDMSNTGNPGFNWYLSDAWPRAGQRGWRGDWTCDSIAFPPIPSSWVTQGAGGITLAPTCTPTLGNLAILSSCGTPLTAPTVPPYITYNAPLAGGKGWYLEDQPSWTGSGQFVFWATSQEFLNFSTSPTFTPSAWFPEIDNPDMGFSTEDVIAWVISPNAADANSFDGQNSGHTPPVSGDAVGMAFMSSMIGPSGLNAITFYRNGVAEVTGNDAPSVAIAVLSHPCLLMSNSSLGTTTFRYARVWQQPI